MRTLTGAAGEVGTISRGGSTNSFRTRLANFLPIAMVAFGVALTAVWTAGLLWMALLLVLLVV
jgi:hypothetical protein